MGNLSEFPWKYRLYLKTYRWQRIDPVPWTPLSKPLQDCRLALISSAGLVGADQEPFEKHIRIGDTGMREISSDVNTATLRDCHRSKAFDHTGIHRDPNLAFPADRLREMADAGFIGTLNHRFFSLMGSVTAPDQLLRHTIPPMVSRLVEDQVDIVLLIPVWPMCNQTVGLTAAALEQQGMSTVVVQLLRLVAEKVRPPRALVVPFPHGYPLDSPDDPAKQRAVIAGALNLLTDPELKPPAIVEYRR